MTTERERLWFEFCDLVGDFGTEQERFEVFEAMLEVATEKKWINGDTPQ